MMWFRAHDSEDISSDEWKLHPKHVFLLSWAGRPIYSRYDESNNNRYGNSTDSVSKLL